MEEEVKCLGRGKTQRGAVSGVGGREVRKEERKEG